LPPLAVKSIIGNPFTELSSVNSTNIYAMDKVQANLAAHGAAFFAWEQTAGKGQMGKKWLAKKGQNCLLSIVIDPSFLSINQQFSLSVAVALAGYDCLSAYIPEDLSIKWPNDLYYRDRKAAGILIENSLQGNKWAWAIAGIGINVNQTEFPELVQKAVSLKQITGVTYDSVLIAKAFCGFLENRFNQLKNKGIDDLLSLYNDRLYKGQTVKLRKNNIVGDYLIKTVDASGELVVEAGIESHFAHGSIEWIG
jgi:BirA family transcriptional regulator, biotin operon repressor / biotin---[acetyl-CoA-carboxylase] ligase